MEKVTFYTRSWDDLPDNEPEVPFKCALCGRDVRGRVLAAWGTNARIKGLEVTRAVSALCGCGAATTFYYYPMGGPRDESIQVPAPQRFYADRQWPPELAALFNEAALAHSQGAYVATAMLCRRLLMVCACREKAEVKGFGQFAYSVDYLVEHVLKHDRAEKALLKTKDIGNAANHELEEVSEKDAQYVLQTTGYLLKTIYSVPEFEEPT